MRVLFDRGTPKPLRRSLQGHAIETADERGWSTLENGELIAQAEAARLRPRQRLPRAASPASTRTSTGSHSRLNLIQALIQVIHAGADEALMLDPRGFVASCNSTNFFIVRQGVLWTSTGAYSFKGITQRNVIDAWTAAGGVAWECDFTLVQVYSAEEAFVTGTLGGVTPVTKGDGRVTGDERPGARMTRAGELYLWHVIAPIQA